MEHQDVCLYVFAHACTHPGLSEPYVGVMCPSSILVLTIQGYTHTSLLFRCGSTVEADCWRPWFPSLLRLPLHCNTHAGSRNQEILCYVVLMMGIATNFFFSVKKKKHYSGSGLLKFRVLNFLRQVFYSHIYSNKVKSGCFKLCSFHFNYGFFKIIVYFRP